MNNEKNKSNTFIYIFLISLIVIAIAFFGYNMLFNTDDTNLLINSGLLILIAINFLYCFKNKYRKLFTIITTILLILFIVFNFLTRSGTINLTKKMPDFVNKNISEAVAFLEKNKIKYDISYENSDEIEEFNIITQSVAKDTPIYEVKDVKFYVSSGPNYDKEVIISNMVGLNIDDALKIINDNYLNNVEVIYEINDEIEKDTIFSQSISGAMKRNDKLVLKVSLGSKGSLKDVEMIDLTNKTLFESTLWLKRNGIDYDLNYDFSKDIKRNYVINQDKKTGTIINPNEDKITLVISKGSEIIVPNLSNMDVSEITEWISNNKLKVKFNEEYSANIPLGKVIKVNYEENDKIEEGTTIEVTTSKGSLKMKSFNSLSEFRSFASTNGITTIEEYEFNDKVSKGSIIRFSLSEGAIINSGDTITVYISNGKSITIPDFTGKSKNNISSTCNNLGLNCTFSYSYSSTVSSGNAISQNKRAGSTVVAGTYVNITISNGKKPASGSSSSSSSSSSNSSSKPTCDKSKTTKVYMDTGNNGSQTKSIIKSRYPDIKWSFNMVSSCPNGSSASGEVCNASSLDGKELNKCDTYTVTIVN